MTDHFGHAVMPQATHDEQAMEDHFLAMRLWTIQNMDPLDKRLVNEVIVPEIEAKTGARPKSSAQMRATLEDHPFHQYWLSLSFFYQDQIWRTLGASVDRQYDTLARAVTEQTAAPRGSLTLDPDLAIPRYIAAFDHHRMPGSYHVDTSDADFRAGALYDRFASTYLRNLNGGWKNDGRGQTLVAHLRDFYPDLKPRRILDLGCSVGHSTVAIAAAFPDAEVHAIDVGAPMLRYGHARAEAMGQAIHFSQQNAERTRFEDGSFDLITSSALLHETSAAAMRNIFAECHRLLRPGGVMAHVEVPPRHEHLGLWEQMRCDFESHYNNEPFMAALSRVDYVATSVGAGFKGEDVIVGYRKGVAEARANRDDFFTQGDPQGRTLLGSWYVCSAVKSTRLN
ncbi:class I SAM-dependent methyltransferase [Nitrospirillum sp. BR 11828]|uniref:class I SAM-dependent methyltransferase n=1 Tax=Nitrospirillum sp. BR 11828 TaxID=3104325 RepID=UPI002ACAFF17|nr:methyltransferase domain-containing protein [Nitrospirillum sp. BR 11828]MDZ5648252.1 methyltransferase domain-containing protein [Nitrospirillum sp. BR 11828]